MIQFIYCLNMKQLNTSINQGWVLIMAVMELRFINIYSHAMTQPS